MRKISIAIFVETFPTISETFILNQITDLINRGHTVKIFALRKGDRKVMHQNILGYDLFSQTYYKEVNYKSKLSRYFYFIKDCFYYKKRINWKLLFRKFNVKKYGKKAVNLDFYLKNKWLLQKTDFDIIHAHFGHVGSQLVDVKIFYRNAKIVVSFHGYDIHPAKIKSYKTSYRELFNITDAVTCNTKYTANLLNRLNFNKEPIILPVGLNTELFKRKTLTKGPDLFRLIFVGRLIALKGPEILIEIFQELFSRGHTNLELIIIGDGPQLDLVKKGAKEFQMENKVKILGKLTQERIREELSEADIFIFPGIVDKSGRAETQGLVIQEAQAMELPVIVSDVGGMKYGLIEGETGYVVKSKNISAFADKIEYLINNKDKRMAMGKAGRAFVTKNYDSRILGNRLESLYQKLLE